MDTPETQFMGKITASVTHEMQNVFAIIKETAGLMEDLIAISKEDRFPHKERFVRAITNIGTQVERGVRLAGRLNNFAHATDEDLRLVDLNEVVANMVFLSQRFARTKRVTLAHTESPEPVKTLTSSMKLHMALFDCVHYLLDRIEAGAAITLRIVRQDDARVAIDFLVQSPNLNAEEMLPDLGTEPGWSLLQEEAHSLKANIETKEAPVWFTLVMQIAD